MVSHNLLNINTLRDNVVVVDESSAVRTMVLHVEEMFPECLDVVFTLHRMFDQLSDPQQDRQPVSCSVQPVGNKVYAIMMVYHNR